MALLATRVKTGDSIDYTPGSAVAAGDVVVIGEIVAVAPVAIAASALGSVDVEGEFDFPKATGSASAIAAGAKVYWDAGNEVVTTTAGANKVAGYTTEASTDDEDTVRVKLARA